MYSAPNRLCLYYIRLLCKATALLLAMLLLLTGTCIGVSADDDQMLLTVNGKTITRDMTVAQVISLFGAPRLTTDSIFGGQAYTFYSDGYQNYIYLETNENGEIASYGTISEGFSSPNFSYGDPEDFIVHSGEFAYNQDDRLYGYIGYCADRFTMNEQIWDANAVHYNQAIWQHAVLMWNAISELYGYHTPLTFNEHAFYAQAQLIENDSNLYDYCNAVGSSDFSLVARGSNAFVGYWYPNPLRLASYARRYRAPEGYYPIFSFDRYDITTIGFLNPSFFDRGQPVAYTQREQQLLAAAREEYSNSVSIWNSTTDYFVTEPQYSTLPLTAGEIRPEKIAGAIGYLNAIRVGAGLPKLTESPELTKGAQCKAALTMYLSKNNISNPSPHNPPHIDGISDEFYALCQNGSGENLFHGNVLTSITNALEDSYGTGQYISRGHRYNLLDPHWKYIGLGSSVPTLSIGTQGVHKFSGYQSCDEELVAWPSKGIMLAEAGLTNMFTACFYKNYTITDQTTVEMTCLNTGESWIFDEEKSTADYTFQRNGNMVSFYNSGVSFRVGSVYQITLKNVQTADGQLTDYTYRSVYETAYVGSADSVTVTLDHQTLQMTPGMISKLSATIFPADAPNKMVWWSSSDPSVVSVTENGTLTAHKKGTVVITAQTDSGISAQATVTVSDGIRGDINGDGFINNKDFSRLKAYLADDTVVIARDNAELTGDSNISNKDLSRLKAYLADDTVAFG